MSEQDPTVKESEESTSLPPDYDAPGQVDYPDPAFEDEADLASIHRAAFGRGVIGGGFGDRGGGRRRGRGDGRVSGADVGLRSRLGCVRGQR